MPRTNVIPQLNEGTSFSDSIRNLRLTGDAESAAFDNYVGHLVIDNSTLTPDVYDEIRRLYPANDASEGAPFNTGDSLFDRGAAWYTDQMFLSGRRHFFQHGADLQPMYAYHFREFIPGNDIRRGGEYRCWHVLIPMIGFNDAIIQ